MEEEEGFAEFQLFQEFRRQRHEQVASAQQARFYPPAQLPPPPRIEHEPPPIFGPTCNGMMDSFGRRYVWDPFTVTGRWQ